MKCLDIQEIEAFSNLLHKMEKWRNVCINDFPSGRRASELGGCVGFDCPFENSRLR